MNYHCDGTACDFMGTGIRVGVAADAPELHITNIATLPNGQPMLTRSFSFDVLQLLQFTMNFTYSLHIFEITGAYNTKTATWSGLIGHLIENKTDIGVGLSSDLVARREVIDYNFALADTRILAVFRKPRFLRDGASVLQPFNTYAWLGITLWALLTAAILFISQRLSQQHGNSVVDDITSCIHMLATLMCSKGLSTPGCDSVRIVAVATGLTIITLTALYTGILVSFLTATSDVFRHLDQLLRTNYDFAIHNYSQALRLRIEEAKSSSLRLLSQRVENSEHGSFAEAKTDLMGGSYVFITTDIRAYESLHHNFSNNERCYIGILRLTVRSTKHGTIIQKNSTLKRPVDYQIQRFKQFGFDKIWSRRYHHKKPTCEEKPYQPIYLSSVLVSLYIFGAGMGSGLSLLIAEFIHHAMTKFRPTECPYLD